MDFTLRMKDCTMEKRQSLGDIMTIKKAVIPAAGFGTRFLPTTKSTPKEMLNIVDRPAIHYVVEEAVKSGIEEILIVTMPHKGAVENYFGPSPALNDYLEQKGEYDLLDLSKSIEALAQISYVNQEEPNGLGQAILLAKDFVGDEAFAVLLADDIIHHEQPCLSQLIMVFNKEASTVIGVQAVRRETVDQYGIVDGKVISKDLHLVSSLVEKPSLKEAPSSLAALGRYIITPEIFEILQRTLPGKRNEIQLTDALKTLAKKEKVLAYEFKGRRYDIGSKLGYLQATVEYGLRHEDLKSDFKAYIKELSNTL